MFLSDNSTSVLGNQLGNQLQLQHACDHMHHSPRHPHLTLE